MPRSTSWIALLASIMALACGTGTTHGSPSASSGAESRAPLSEAQSVDVLTTINRGEIDLARLVDARATSASAHEMAQMMITQHTEAQSEIAVWSHDASVTPAQNDVSSELARQVAAVRADLRAASDASVGHTYLVSQVSMHRDALALIDHRMIPGAHDPAFREPLARVRAAVSAHMAHAQHMLDDAR